MRPTKSFIFYFIFVLAFHFSPASGQDCGPQWLEGQAQPNYLSRINGTIWCSVNWDPDGAGPLPPYLVVGGNFYSAGSVTAYSIAAWTGSEWTSFGDGLLNGGRVGYVSALVALPDGSLLAGGLFDSADEVPVQNLARWDGNAWTPLNISFDPESTVNALALLPTGELAIGGRFLQANGVSVNNVLLWDGLNCIPMETGIGDDHSQVNTFALMSNGDLVAGGIFRTAGATDARSIAIWNGQSWSSLHEGLRYPDDTVDGSVRRLLCTPDGRLYVGGGFALAGQTPAANAAMWDGGSWVGMPGLPDAGGVSSLISVQGEIFAAGSFDFPLGTRETIVHWNGTVWESMSEGIFGSDAVLQVLHETTGGDFLAIESVFPPAPGFVYSRVLRWNGTQWVPRSPSSGAGLNREIVSLTEMPNGEVVAQGLFQSAGNSEAFTIARWNGVDWAPIHLQTPTDQVQSVYALPTGELLVGIHPGRVLRGSEGNWTELGPGFMGGFNNIPVVSAFAVLPSGDIVAGGCFDAVGGISVNSIARWNGASWSAMGSGFRNTNLPMTSVFSLAVLSDGSLAAGGFFNIASGQLCNNVARWNGQSWAPFGEGLSGHILATAFSLQALPGNRLAACGLFFLSGDETLNSIGIWDGDRWNPLGGGLNGVISSVRSVPNGDLIAAGSFSVVDDPNIRRLARWNGSSWSAIGDRPDNTVRDVVALRSGELAIGGTFRNVGDRVSDRWARWSETGIPWVAVQPQSQQLDRGETLSVTAVPARGYKNLRYQWKRNGVNIVNGLGGASSGGGLVSGAVGSLETPTENLGSTLTILGIQTSDGGEYTVVFENDCGPVESQVALVDVVHACAADFNGDGAVNVQDFMDFLDRFYAGEADFNRDGSYDSQDFFDFAYAYFSGC